MKPIAAIVGYGETKFGKVGKDSLQLNVKAAKDAIMDAGLKNKDIEGILAVPTMLEQRSLVYSAAIAEELGIYPKYNSTINTGGATACAMAEIAASMIHVGMIDNVLCVGGDNLLTCGTDALEVMFRIADPEFEQPYGANIPARYALIARRHMHEYGTTGEELAEIAVSTREWASMNPNAQFRKRITVDDVLNSPMIADPLHLLDCSPISDGGGAFIVTSVEQAKEITDTPIYITGMGEYHTHAHLSRAPSLTTFGGNISGKRAFKMAGITPHDIDVTELYDCFTITALTELEDLGFVEKGKAGAFLEDGQTYPGGNLPMNTNGGLLSQAHPGMSGSIFHVIEATRQLMGRAGKRQVEGAEIAIVHGIHEILDGACTLILKRGG